MSESIGEMILPGTYIDVRAEGLIGVGGISTGNLGVVGTANRGPIGEVVVLGSYAEALDTFGAYDGFRNPQAVGNPLTLTRLLEQAFRGGASTVYAVRVANGSPGTVSWPLNGAGPALLFTLRAKTPGSWAEGIVLAPSPAGTRLVLTYGRFREVFEGATAAQLAAAINATSQLVTATTPAPADAGTAWTAVGAMTAAGTNGAGETSVQVEAGLALLANQEVNLVICGLNAAAGMATVAAHLEATENDGRERIAVLGASSDTASTILSADRGAGGGPRVVLVAPGIKSADAADSGNLVDLPGPYAAALVAGRLATLAPHVSLTNKTLPTAGVTTEYTRAVQKQLLQGQVMVIHKQLGFRALKGITTDTGAFKQISVRRIVDFAKAGVRQGSNPYIGRLNNARVRSALKATLDGFLSQMVLDEMLVGYTLDVTATRAQEIQGVALVTMTLQPTFSIDFVKVIMNLE
jgi:hypothetical protein